VMNHQCDITRMYARHSGHTEISRLPSDIRARQHTAAPVTADLCKTREMHYAVTVVLINPLRGSYIFL